MGGVHAQSSVCDWFEKPVLSVLPVKLALRPSIHNLREVAVIKAVNLPACDGTIAGSRRVLNYGALDDIAL
eukprot:344311-Amphidinium_carterae.1